MAKSKLYRETTFANIVMGGDFHVSGEAFYKLTECTASALADQDSVSFDGDDKVQIEVKVWKPTQDQCNSIKAAAYKECGCRVRLEPGIRCSTVDDTIDDSINLLLVDKTESEGFVDSDLADFADWSTFRKGVPLTDDGRAFVDFYCYNSDGLVSNLGVDYDNGTIECMGTRQGMARDRQAQK